MPAVEEAKEKQVMDMFNKALEHTASKYENVREGMKQGMRGRLLDYEARRIRNEGWAEGFIKAGHEYGLSERQILESLQKKMGKETKTWGIRQNWKRHGSHWG